MELTIVIQSCFYVCVWVPGTSRWIVNNAGDNEAWTVDSTHKNVINGGDLDSDFMCYRNYGWDQDCVGEWSECRGDECKKYFEVTSFFFFNS